MLNMLDGLEEYGLKDLENLNIYEEKKIVIKNSVKKANINPEDCLYQKSVVCPSCDNSFKETAIRSGKIKLVSLHTDLRPYYEPIDPLLYDVIICPNCGYSAISMFFPALRYNQSLLIKDNITPKFKYKQHPLLLTTDMAIERYKLALLNTIIKKSKDSEKAYTCMKLAWLYRGKKDLKKEESYMRYALDGYKSAFEKERFPICGMNEPTYMYIVGELSRRLGKLDDALKWLGKVITFKNVNTRLKERALEIKDLINESKKTR